MKRCIISRIPAVCGLIFFTLLLGGCLKKSDIEVPAVKTYLSIMHLAPSAPAAEVYINNFRETDAIPPGASFSYYVGTTPGKLDIKFKKAGADSVIAAVPTSEYDSLQFYTVVLCDDPVNAGKVKAIKIKDDFGSLKADKATYRFFNMNSDLGKVSFYIDNELVSGERTNADIADNSSLRLFQQYPQGNYTIKAKVASTDSLIAQTSAQFAVGNAYTIFLHGVSNGTGAKALKLVVLRATN